MARKAGGRGVAGGGQAGGVPAAGFAGGRALPLIVYLALSLAIMLPLLAPGYYLALDMQFGPSSFSSFQFPDLYGFSPSPYGAYLPLKMALSAVSAFVPPELIEKALLLAILLLCGLSMHFSLPGKLGASRYFAGIFYVLNPFVFVRFIVGHWTLLLSYAVWPFAVKLFLDFLERPDDRRAFAACALATAAAAISSHGELLLLMAFGAIFIFRNGWKLPSRKLLAGTALLGCAVLAMNLYWIIPTAMQFGSSFSPAPASSYLQDFGARGTGLPLPLALLTLHGFWRGGVIYTKDVFSLWYVPFAAILLLAGAGLAAALRGGDDNERKRERALAASLISVSAVAFLLAMGSSGPLYPLLSSFGGTIYFAFRDTQKFIALLPLAYSTFGAYGLAWLSGMAGRAKPLLLAVAFAAVLLHNYGFFGLLGQIGPTQYPADWAAAGSIMSADNVSGALLVLPSHLYYEYYWAGSYQKTIGNPAAQFFPRPVVGATSIESGAVQNDEINPQEAYLDYMFRNRQYINGTAEMLLPLGVRYVIILKTDPDSDNYLWLFKRKGGVANITLAYESRDIYLFRDDLVTGPLMASGEDGSGGFGAIYSDAGRGVYSGNVSYSEANPAVFEVRSSGEPYAVFASPSPFLSFSGSPLSPWHGLASSFQPSSPGTLYNGLFYLTAALLLLAWLAFIWLSAGPGPVASAIAALAAMALFLLLCWGVIGPSAVGAAFILSALWCASSRWPWEGFLNLI